MVDSYIVQQSEGIYFILMSSVTSNSKDSIFMSDFCTLKQNAPIPSLTPSHSSLTSK